LPVIQVALKPKEEEESDRVGFKQVELHVKLWMGFKPAT